MGGNADGILGGSCSPITLGLGPDGRVCGGPLGSTPASGAVQLASGDPTPPPGAKQSTAVSLVEGRVRVLLWHKGFPTPRTNLGVAEIRANYGAGLIAFTDVSYNPSDKVITGKLDGQDIFQALVEMQVHGMWIPKELTTAYQGKDKVSADDRKKAYDEVLRHEKGHISFGFQYVLEQAGAGRVFTALKDVDPGDLSLELVKQAIGGSVDTGTAVLETSANKWDNDTQDVDDPPDLKGRSNLWYTNHVLHLCGFDF